MCWPWSHNWNKWEMFEQGKTLLNPLITGKILGDDSRIIGVYEYQRRTCLLCGKSQLREVEA